MSKLADTLKDARVHMGLTLRQVEKESGISNAYLSQLENDKIKKPSASVLYKLASLYKMDIKLLLNASGVIQSDNSIKSEWAKRIAFLADGLESDQQQQVLDYINFIKNR